MDPKHWLKRDWIRIIMKRILSTVLMGLDPHHNEMDPKHWLKRDWIRIIIKWVLSTGLNDPDKIITLIIKKLRD